jgi:hypothetical protein
MNNRQKLVQQQYLNNEKGVIKRLEQVYGKSLNDINSKINNLQFKIDKLQLEYDWLDPDDPERAKVKSMIQSKIYQKKYQEQLKSQVDGVLKQMQTKQYLTVSDYLDECYTDGFIGTVFDAHGQGVPFISPINQESMVRAVQLESKISQGLYTRLGEDVNMLKKKITAQISRSIATGMSYAQTAKALEGYTNIGFNNAVRIARTEGHRIQTTAAMDAMESAVEKGADVVKQWDAALDAKTRESHQVVDGEIRELKKRFSNGLMFPGDPSGKAAEVINCRCALLQRAKWALDDDELQTLKDRAAYYGLDKADQFDDFKKKYLKAVEKVEPVVPIHKFTPAKTIEEAEVINSTKKAKSVETKRKPKEPVSVASDTVKQPTKKSVKTIEPKIYAQKELDEMSIVKLRKIAINTAVQYYDSGLSGISFGSRSHKEVAEALVAQGSKTSLKKDILSMQKKMKKAGILKG